jgi:hypothetical protein
MKNLIGVCVLCCATLLLAQEPVPKGTILPVELKSSLDSRSAKPGQVVMGRIAQDVPLPQGRIRQGSKVTGHVVAATKASGNDDEGQITLRFDTLMATKQKIAISTNLRALASPMEVWDAQLPLTGPDRGMSENAWNTVLVGDDEVAYRGGGPVAKGLKVVGEPTAGGGVLVNVSADAHMRCGGERFGNDRMQALWVFSSDACGLYGYPSDVKLLHAGRSNPVGQFTLSSTRGDVALKSGSGILLRVIEARP